jgi:NAD(P)-dependent dehydrogenase (short-subunit alcohol dehydrogenase family)
VKGVQLQLRCSKIVAVYPGRRKSNRKGKLMSSKRQTALITGAGSGIGRAIAVALAAAGMDVASVDINLDTAEAVTKSVEQQGVAGLALQADVGDVGEINQMVASVVERFGKLDVIVNNAGVTRAADIMDLGEDDWDWIHRVNAKGVFFCLQAAARQMIAQADGGYPGGRIINMGSIAGRGFIGTSNAAYAASKGAVISLTKIAAQQLGRHDITVNAICPGITRTPIVDEIIATRAKDRGLSEAEITLDFAKDVPIKRINEPEDIAAMAVFLASPGARNITGQSYNVDGGLITS